MDNVNFTISGTGKEVFKALFNAKKLLGSTVAPEGKNPHFGNDYIQLDTLTKKIDPVTEKCGLLISHFPTGRGLVTLVVHKESGQFIQCTYELVLERETAQGISSSLTYAKRQLLQSIFNLSPGIDDPSDDDGEAAEVRTPPKEKKGKKLTESEKIKAKIQDINELEELKLYFGTMPVTYQNNDKIVEMFKAKKAEIGLQAN